MQIVLNHNFIINYFKLLVILIFADLWNEYLKLRKYCEDADIKIPFQLLKSESDNKDV